jgi:spore cortex biosynthesis protein YabQ
MHPFQYVTDLFFASWAMGAVFDIYNTVTGSTKWLRWLRPALDLLFWALSAGFIFLILYHTDNGRLRLYTFLLLAGGYLAYRMFLHRTIVRSAFAVVRLVRAMVMGVVRTLDVLLFRPVRALFRLAGRVLALLYRLLCRLEDVLFWLLGRAWKWTGAWWWQPFSRRPAVQKFTRSARGNWEGFWSRVSKWIRKRPTEV